MNMNVVSKSLTHPAARRLLSGSAAGLFSLGLAALTPAMAAPLSAAETQAVLAPFQAVLDGVAQRNHEMVRKQLLTGGTAALIRDGKILQLHFDAFVERLPTTGTEKLEEVMHNPIVHVDDDIAVVWAPYTFTIDGRLDHCGTDIVTMARRDGRWLISSVEGNSRKNCPAS
jgi:hypothetical protein